MQKINRFAFLGVVLLSGLLAVQVGFAGEPPSVGESVPADKLAAYSEVSAAMAAHPEMSREDMEALLREHKLSTDEYERIDEQIRGDLDQSAPQAVPDVKAKQKETTA